MQQNLFLNNMQQNLDNFIGRNQQLICPRHQLPNERFSITQIPIGHYYIRIELQNGKVLEDILIKQ